MSSMLKLKKSLLEIQDRSTSSIPCSLSPSYVSLADSFNLYTKTMPVNTGTEQSETNNLLIAEMKIVFILSFTVTWV